MHIFTRRFANRRTKIRRKHRPAGRRAGQVRRVATHDPSACIQPLDAAFDNDGGAFLEGWLRAEHVTLGNDRLD